MHEEMGDQSIKAEIHLLSTDYKEPAIHLFRINPLAISGVYFGCNAIESLSLENIERNSALKHLINIYKMRINDTEYQLTPVKLTKNS
ncbi:hypothetical protein SAMN03159355_05504 [Pseudomonas sp. NFPP10]|nr:hypothetical protein SAMN03159465_01484 [Pseudomonas sp. NFPP12]SEM61148.1 hypothetical protein SAMN03159355_05504 [Pseudomonas sp. NFPP10]SFI22072.1 hypothetical protein SAMN03159416_01434 [Pseudomonas sp. NFPP08]SFN51255.1 hypothetical protein SAMN03159476_05551 [Pseudomonas sp. NFPP05]SFY03183.1 hypothetical protein SAMN03159479_05506 [Pseudomonas sp. NFPP09]